MSQLKKFEDNLKTQIDCFDEDLLDQIAKNTFFIQRSSNKVSAKDFFELMTIEHFEKGVISLEGLVDILREKESKSDITPQALNKKINNENAVEFLKCTLETIYNNQIKTKLDQIPLEILEHFPNVYLEDSTQIQLNEDLSEDFKGVGGSASKSSIKLDLLYEVRSNSLKKITICEGSYSDQRNGKAMLNEIKDGDLIIRDLGYFDLSAFKEIEETGYYLSRLFKSCNVYLSSDPNAEAINITKYVKSRINDLGIIDMEVYLGDQRLKCRLLCYKCSEQVISERRRKAKRAAQKNGRSLKQDNLDWLDYTFYVTNVDAEILSGKIIGTIYRLRWQIELIFKQWKQLFKIDVMKGTRPERIKVLLYGRLIMINIVTQIYSFCMWYGFSELDREVSAVKLIQWLQRKGRLVQSIINNSISTLMEKLLNSLPKGLLKQKRKRKTTFELIRDEVEFLESFNEKDICGTN